MSDAIHHLKELVKGVMPQGLRKVAGRAKRFASKLRPETTEVAPTLDAAVLPETPHVANLVVFLPLVMGEAGRAFIRNYFRNTCGNSAIFLNEAPNGGWITDGPSPKEISLSDLKTNPGLAFFPSPDLGALPKSYIPNVLAAYSASRTSIVWSTFLAGRDTLDPYQSGAITINAPASAENTAYAQRPLNGEIGVQNLFMVELSALNDKTSSPPATRTPRLGVDQLLELVDWRVVQRRSYPIGQVVAHPCGALKLNSSTFSLKEFINLPELQFDRSTRLLTRGSHMPRPGESSVVVGDWLAQDKNDERPTVLIILPFLALGGAEDLTRDILECGQDRARFVVVTLEPHLAARGLRIDEFQKTVDHVIYLGDIIEPSQTESFFLRLIKATSADTLFIANGSNLVYDLLPAITKTFPQLSVVGQVFDHEAGWIARYNEEKINANIHHHIAPNQRIFDTLHSKYSIPESKISLIYHGIDLRRFDPARFDDAAKTAIRVKLGVPLGKRVILFAGRLHPQKRPLDFTQLARRFQNLDRDDVFFLQAGGGLLTSEVQNYVAMLRVKNYRLIAPHDPVEELFAIADVLVLHSEYEGLPLVSLIAAAFNMPILSTKVGDMEEALHNCAILIDQVGNIDKFEKELIKILASGPTTDGRKRAMQSFDIQRQTNLYMQALLPQTNSLAAKMVANGL